MVDVGRSRTTPLCSSSRRLNGGGEAAVPGAEASKARSFRIASQSASLIYSEGSRFILLGSGAAGSLGRTSVEEPATALDGGLSQELRPTGANVSLCGTMPESGCAPLMLYLHARQSCDHALLETMAAEVVGDLMPEQRS